MSARTKSKTETDLEDAHLMVNRGIADVNIMLTQHRLNKKRLDASIALIQQGLDVLKKVAAETGGR